MSSHAWRLGIGLALVMSAGCSQWLLGVDNSTEGSIPSPSNAQDAALISQEDASVMPTNQQVPVDAAAVPAVTDAGGGGTVSAPDSAVPPPACVAPSADCDNDPSHSCETNLAVSVGHCGACARVCTAPANAAPRCAAGDCDFVCASGYEGVGAACQVRGPANACTAAHYALYSNISYCFISRNQLCGPTDRCSDCDSNECCAETVRSGRTMRACLATSY